MGGRDIWMSMAIKVGKVQFTSRIQCRCQYGQTRRKSRTTSTLTVKNGEATTHHLSYDREGEKQIGVCHLLDREDTQDIGSGLG